MVIRGRIEPVVPFVVVGYADTLPRSTLPTRDILYPVTLEFTGDIWYWRGPAPFYFVTVPEAEARQIKEMERMVTYGWGMIPVTAMVGKTQWTTSLWPKDGLYVLPLKVVVRRAEKLEEGQLVAVRLKVGGE